MAEQDPIYLNLAGTTFLLAAETGGLIQAFSRATERQWIWVYGADVGYDIGAVVHNPAANYTIRIIRNGNNGLSAASPGVALTLANTSTGNGVSAGGIYCMVPTLDHQGGQLREYSVTAIQKPGIN